MASGKSEELISMAYAYKEAFEDAGEGVVVVASHRLSVLRGDGVIKSRTGSFIEAKIVESLKELDLPMDPSEPHFIFVDEVHFFPVEEAYYLAELARKNYVMAAGLDTDFRGEPWPFTANLLALADLVTKRVARCAKCGEYNANRTQRLVHGKPARYHDHLLLPGDDEERDGVRYEPRCIACHEVIK